MTVLSAAAWLSSGLASTPRIDLIRTTHRESSGCNYGCNTRRGQTPNLPSLTGIRSAPPHAGSLVEVTLHSDSGSSAPLLGKKNGGYGSYRKHHQCDVAQAFPRADKSVLVVANVASFFTLSNVLFSSYYVSWYLGALIAEGEGQA